MITLLGWIWWWLLPVRKGLAIANFKAAFPDHDPRELRRGVGLVAWSYLQLLWGTRARIEGLEHCVPRAGQGVIGLAGHGGAWDIALISVAQRVPITIFVKEPSDRLAAWGLRRLRAQADLELLPPSGSMAAAYAALERGRMVIFVQDQRHNAGLAVPFFGRPALTSPAFAAMVWRTRAPVVGAWQWHDERGHVCRFEPLHLDLPDERDPAIISLTAFSQGFYERMIRTAPHSWLWLHDRWRPPAG